jgi:hypothetical protein
MGDGGGSSSSSSTAANVSAIDSDGQYADECDGGGPRWKVAGPLVVDAADDATGPVRLRGGGRLSVRSVSSSAVGVSVSAARCRAMAVGRCCVMMVSIAIWAAALVVATVIMACALISAALTVALSLMRVPVTSA